METKDSRMEMKDAFGNEVRDDMNANVGGGAGAVAGGGVGAVAGGGGHDEFDSDREAGTKNGGAIETENGGWVETKEDGWGTKGGRWEIKEASDFEVLSELDIARFLRQRRIKLTELAQYCGVSISAISKKIGKNKNMRLESLYQIASVLRVDPREFFFPVERKPVYDLSKVSDIQGTGETEALREVGAEEDVVQKLSPEAFCPHCGSRVRVSVTISKA